MPSHAQRHQMRVLAARAAAKAAPEMPATSGEARTAAMFQLKLEADRRRLKTIKSRERKIEAKRSFLPFYEPYVEGALQSGTGEPDDLLGFVMVWRIDVGDYAGALALGRYFIEHKLALPDRFERSADAALSEEIALAALAAYREGKPFDINVLREVIELTADEDMHDEIRAKTLLALGRHLRAEKPVEALHVLVRAVALFDGVGAKKDIEQLRTQIKNDPELAAELAANPLSDSSDS